MGTRLREAELQQSLAVALFECFGEVKCWYEKVLLCWQGTVGLTWGKEEENGDEKQEAVLPPQKICHTSLSKTFRR